MRQEITASKLLRNCLKVPIGAASARRYDAARSDNMASATTSPMHVLAQDLADMLGLAVSDDFNVSPLTERFDGNGTPPLGSGGYDWQQSDYDAVFKDYDGCDILTGTDGAMPNDWHGPYLVRGRTGHGEREACAAVFVGTHSVDCVDGPIIAYSLWLAVPDCEILLSDSRGRFIPRDFVRDFIGVEPAEEGETGLYGAALRLIDESDGTGICKWVPGYFDSSPVDSEESVVIRQHGHVLDFYADTDVDSNWDFDRHVLGDVLTCLDPESEWYWEAWDSVMRNCKARLFIDGTLCDGTVDAAEYDAILEQNSDLFVLFYPRLR